MGRSEGEHGAASRCRARGLRGVCTLCLYVQNLFRTPNDARRNQWRGTIPLSVQILDFRRRNAESGALQPPNRHHSFGVRSWQEVPIASNTPVRVEQNIGGLETEGSSHGHHLEYFDRRRVRRAQCSIPTGAHASLSQSFPRATGTDRAAFKKERHRLSLSSIPHPRKWSEVRILKMKSSGKVRLLEYWWKRQESLSNDIDSIEFL